MKATIALFVLLASVSYGLVSAATVVPNEIQMPGTQPLELANNLANPSVCSGCHSNYGQQAVEPFFNWQGSMMANASRDPLFWAQLAIAEQDFNGGADFCLRCHVTTGWYAGRSTPTDGSALLASDGEGVTCDTCHRMTNTDNSEHQGAMNAPFIANNESNPATGYYGSGMLSLYDPANSFEKLGPYASTAAPHPYKQSKFHRSQDFCGSCHDVSNPFVGDMAHNNGKLPTGDPVIASGVLSSPVTSKAAFNNFPYQYGIVERTYSEFKSGLLSTFLVSNYPSLPSDLKAGAIKRAYDSALGDYSDGTPRYFTCQTCHLRATTGQGSNNPADPVRTDLPLHDLTGGNYWAQDAIIYEDSLGALRLGGGLSATQINALNASKARAKQTLSSAASLSVTGTKLKVVNLTGHKLFSGYPEGRRMWLNVKWYNNSGTLLREDGKYGAMTVNITGTNVSVNSILNLSDPNTKIYEAHSSITQEWANQLLGLGVPVTLPVSFNRTTGAVEKTLGQVAAQAPNTYQESFHFILNNNVAHDNRIPPYGMSYDEARKRNALPVPPTQYSTGLGGGYDYWDTIQLNTPAGATYATINLLYQPTSWEYIEFLYLANNGQNPFLANEGTNLLKAWLNTGMAEPYVMASTTWGSRLFLPFINR